MADTGITWGPASDTSSSGITWGTRNDPSPQSDFSPAGFTTQYSDAISNAATKLGVPASAIAGQWGLETGWGKSVIPGTNNLGNIKSTNGKGVKATDNATGSNDAYQQYESPMAFSNAYVNLIKSNYPKAVGAQDPAAFATALKQGGYAEDSKYVGKVSSAANMATKALALATGSNSANAAEQPSQSSAGDFNAFLAQATKNAPLPQPTVAVTQPDTSDDSFNDFLKQAQQPAQNKSTLGRIWDTVKEIPHEVKEGVTAMKDHPWDATKSAASAVWNPLVNLAANSLVTDPGMADPMSGMTAVDPKTKAYAVQAAKNANITPNANTDQKAWNAGHFIGNMAASTAVGLLAPEIPMLAGAGLAAKAARAAAFVGNNAIQGGIQGGVSAALDGASPSDIVSSAGFGAAGGAVLSPVAAAIGSAAKPVISKVMGTKAAQAAADQTATDAGRATGAAFTPAEKEVAARVAAAVNADGTSQTAHDVAAQMSANAKSAVPGYQRTAAEATDNPTIQAIQQGLDKSDNNAALSARATANAEANTAFLRQGATSDADLAAQKQAFQQSQDALAARGNVEMPAISSADAAPNGTFGTPAMQRTLNRANAIAQNDGSAAIQTAFDSPNRAMVDAWNNGIAGSAAKTAGIELDRKFVTSPMYESALDKAAPIAIDRDVADLLNKPALQTALSNVERYKLNAGDRSPVLREIPAVGADGQTYQRSITPQDLNLAKMYLDDHIQSMGNPQSMASADKWMRGTYIENRNIINDVLEKRVPGFREANVEYAKLSDQMAESQFLTHLNMVDATGKMNMRQLDATIKSIEAGKANTNPQDPAKLVSAAKLSQLKQMHADLVAATRHASSQGLQGDAYNYLREAATKDPVAAAALQQHLEARSPAYKQFYHDQLEGTNAISQQENYNELVKRFDTRTDGNVSWHDTKNLASNYPDYSPENVARLNAVRDNQERFANRTERVAGSDTASNFAKREGFENLVAANRGKGIGNTLMGEEGQRAVRSVAGVGGTLLGGHSLGILGALGGDYLMDKVASGAAKTLGRVFGGESEKLLATKTAANRDAMEKLLLDPQRAADAIKALDVSEKEKQRIAESLLSNVAATKKGAGLLGAIASGQAASNAEKKR